VSARIDIWLATKLSAAWCVWVSAFTLQGAAAQSLDLGHCRLESFPRGERNGFNFVSIQISDKGAIIVGIVVFTNAGRSLVSGTIRKSAFVESSHRLPVGGLKRDVDSIAWSSRRAINRRFQAEHDIGRSKVDSLV
jgi:hypothetical protein